MNTEIRPITAEEWDTYIDLDAYSFGYRPSPELGVYYREQTAVEDTLAVFADGRMVAHLIAMPWRMAINGRALPTGAIADVAVWPEDRRSGHAAAMLRACLASMRERGLALSMLYPTFPALYQRFGWAHAAEERLYRFRPEDVRLAYAPGSTEARVVRRDTTAIAEMAAVYERGLADANCWMVRDEKHWRVRRLWNPAQTAPRQVLIALDAKDEPRGYLIHETPAKTARAQGNYGQELPVVELVAESAAAYRSLVEILIRHDLCDQVQWPAPVDDPFLSLLATPRAVQVEQRPSFMLRIVDVPAALRARGSSAAGLRLTIRVRDEAATWNDGTWVVEAGEGTIDVRAGTGDPDATIGIGALSALFNGYLSPQRAVLAGLLTADGPALVKLAQLFSVTVRPYCPDYF